MNTGIYVINDCNTICKNMGHDYGYCKETLACVCFSISYPQVPTSATETTTNETPEPTRAPMD